MTWRSAFVASVVVGAYCALRLMAIEQLLHERELWRRDRLTAFYWAVLRDPVFRQRMSSAACSS